MIRKLIGVIFVLGALVGGAAAVTAHQRGERVSGMEASIPIGAGAGVGFLLGVALLRGGKKRKG